MKKHKITIRLAVIAVLWGLINAILPIEYAYAVGPVLNSIILSDPDSGSTEYTNNSYVTVAINVSGSPTQMILSIYNDFHDTTWVTYTNPATYTFASIYNGPRTVYCKLRNTSLEESNTVSDSILMDLMSPAVSFGNSLVIDNNNIDIAFTELMGNGDDTSKYSIDNDVSVLSVQPQPANNRYRLTTTTQTAGVRYVITCSLGMCDRAGNLINPGARAYSYIAVAPPQDTTLPVANAGPDKSAQVGVQVNFDGSASTDNIGVTRYVWNFGDGSPNAEGATISHSYATPNIYTVTLTVYDAAGNYGSDTAQVTITESPGSTYLKVGGPSPDYNTITDAMAHIAAGGTIYVYAGVYPEIVHLKNGITLKGDNNETVIIKGAIIAEEASATIENLSILYREGTMLSFNNANYVDLKLVADAGVTAINSPLAIKKCIIKPDLDFINNEGGYNPPLEYYGKGIQIWNMYGTDSMVPQIESNLIQNTDCGIYYFSQAFGGAILGNIKNNTFYHNKDGVILRMHKENPHIYNNIFDSSENAAIFLTYEDGDLFNQRKANINNNLFNQNAQSFSLNGNDRSSQIIGIQYNIQEDPLFADSLHNDFHLNPGSPCLGAGEGDETIGAFGQAVVSELFIEITSPQDGITIYPEP